VDRIYPGRARRATSALAHRSKRRLPPEFGGIDAKLKAKVRIHQRSECVGARTARLLAAALCGLACLAAAAATAVTPAMAKPAEAAKPPVKIAVLHNTRNDQCYDPGDIPAIKRLTALQRERINRAGGIAGRRLIVEYLDDLSDAKKTIANIQTAMADKQMIALVGLGNTNRAKEVFDTIGADIKASGIPWISNLSVNSLFEDYPNVFTMRGAQEFDSIPVMTQFMKDQKVSRPAFIGLKDQVFSTALDEGIKERMAPMTFAADIQMPLVDDKLTPEDTAAMVEELKRANPDFLITSIGGNRMAGVLKALEAAEIKAPMFVSGRLETLFAEGDVTYPGDLYQLAWDGLPDAYNDRVRRRLFTTQPEEWIFEGRRNAKAPGWTSGECKKRSDDIEPDVLSSANLRAVGVGLQFGDMIGLVAETLKSGDVPADHAALRARIADRIKTSFEFGRGVYVGDYENWSFRPSSRAAARTPLIVTHPKGFATEQLASTQYVALKNDTLRRIQTLYLDIDLTRAFRIDDREKSFAAEFYLSMHVNKNESIDQLEFSNAFLDPQTNTKQITIRPLHQGGASDAYPENMKIYAVSGKFMFQPSFGNYPFDTQRFAIDIRSKTGDAPVIIQPSPVSLRDQAVETEGWSVRRQYVGYDQDFLPVIDAKSHERSIVPFYKGSFVWVMKREATDYFLTVVVPLAFIMIIAYLAIFIPRGHFEAIVTIQVTALLSAVALYITISKVAADEATVSDKIFLFDYMLISLMIVISILRVNRLLGRVPRLDAALGVIHVVLIPVLVALMTLYVIGSSSSEGRVASGFVPAMKNALWRD
jgi:ABC-type branched-subunit amino acid transport system substrate-binding protein